MDKKAASRLGSSGLDIVDDGSTDGRCGLYQTIGFYEGNQKEGGRKE